jgi:hypothetical protein
VSKAERLPRWAFRRLTDQQKEAHNRLVWYAPGPAERARLKKVLGWRRTRTETTALAWELLDQGRSRLDVAAEIGIGVRYLDRLLDGDGTAPNGAEKASVSKDVPALTGETDPGVPPA